jgi:hypothetical protein
MRGTRGGSQEPIMVMLFLILGALGRKGIFIFPIFKD